jgi:hypothetical protein
MVLEIVNNNPIRPKKPIPHTWVLI